MIDARDSPRELSHAWIGSGVVDRRDPDHDHGGAVRSRARYDVCIIGSRWAYAMCQQVYP